MTKILKRYVKGELVYPNPTKDGLKLWYNVAGKRNTDADKGVIEDLSGNGNSGQLHNFNFTEESGYKNNKLHFDGVDDKLEILELGLNHKKMSVQLDEDVYSYEDDKVLTVGEEGEIIGSGVNLIEDSFNGIPIYPNAPSNSFNLTFYEGYAEVTPVANTQQLSSYTGTTLELNTGIYTDSVEVYSEVPVEMRLSSTAGDYTSVPANTWTRLYVTGEHKGGQYRVIGLYTKDNMTAPIKYRKYQTERNSIPTKWIPSSKDLQTTEYTSDTLSTLQLYNKTLNKTELLQNAEKEQSKKLIDGVVVQDGLMLHYDFSKESNNSEYKGKAFDYSGNQNHGELKNFNYTDESGYVGDGLKFDGVDDRLHLYINEIDASNFHLSYTADHSDVSNSSQHTIRVNLTNGKSFLLFKSGNGQLGYYSSSSTNYYTGFTPKMNEVFEFSINIENKKVAIVLNGERIDGVEDGGLSEIKDLGVSITTARHIGSIRSIKIYNRPLTPEEIAHNYAIEKEKFNITEGDA